MSENSKIRILGVELDNIGIDEAASKFVSVLKGDDQHYAVTPNSEILLKSLEDSEYRDILNKAFLKVPDGAGQMWASSYLVDTANKGWIFRIFYFFWSAFFFPWNAKRRKTVIPERVTGVDLMEKVCSLSGVERFSVFLLGAAEGVAEIAAENLENKYPGSFFVGTYSGGPAVEDEDKIVSLINIVQPQVLFVAFGAPWQESWIARNLAKMPSVKMAMGVGGSFDFLAGYKRRAPNFMRVIGLEWLYRLFKEPGRFGRIWNAVVVFPFTILMRRDENVEKDF
ncbi:glycosyltransferase [Candidatus Peregrinibacteria bacterium HGW-Peregrinibacteria-1]|jgi:N-acetylglucosaminyldiphosphoundecaprenol N-acetyl-beta-D-mannosaminyltransferase|nr:MAG: glycosyltransferase [Candidatus Peregrinibacteria bacterium HGW-Peregrinibacteria-1]